MNNKQRRLLLQSELEGYFEDDPRVSDPSLHVSFQPDEASKIPYPHIVYRRDPAYEVPADNLKYIRFGKYEVTVIDRNPDSPVFDKLEVRDLCGHSSTFVMDGLNHFVFALYH